MSEQEQTATLAALKIAFTYMPKAIEVNKYEYGERYQLVLEHIEKVREALLINGIDPEEVDGEVNDDIKALEFLGVVFDDGTPPKTYKGELYLEFNGQVCYQADVSKCIVRTNEIALDFSGSDEGNRFEGSCKLTKDKIMYSGIGSFKFVNDVQSTQARITTSYKEDDDELTLQGLWQDDGDHEAYKLSIELYGATLE